MGGRARWDRQRVEPASSWTSRHHRCLLGNPLLLRVDLLGQLAEDVIDLLVDGEPAAAKAISAQRTSSVRRKLGLCARRQTVVELSDHSVQQVETATNVVTAKVQFRMVTVLSSLICSIALCAVRKVYFSAQPNNLKLILNFQKYYPIEHIFVPACSSARKIHFFKL